MNKICKKMISWKSQMKHKQKKSKVRGFFVYTDSAVSFVLYAIGF